MSIRFLCLSDRAVILINLLTYTHFGISSESRYICANAAHLIQPHFSLPPHFCSAGLCCCAVMNSAALSRCNVGCCKEGHHVEVLYGCKLKTSQTARCLGRNFSTLATNYINTRKNRKRELFSWNKKLKKTERVGGKSFRQTQAQSFQRGKGKYMRLLL